MCNTLITFLIIKKFLYKPVRKMLAARQQEVHPCTPPPRRRRARPSRCAKIHRASVKAKEEAAEIVGSATRRAAERAMRSCASPRRGIRYGQEGRARHRAGAHQGAQGTQDEVADLSVMIASKIVERDVKPEDHERFIEDFIDKVG